MNKLEKQKLQEISDDIYRLNTLIGVNYIGLKYIPCSDELLEINDRLARVIRQLRDLTR